MKIAIPTSDGSRISSNIQRIKGFVIFEISKGKIIDEKFVIKKDFNLNGQETAKGNGNPFHENAIPEPRAILSEISDCQIVISNGFGKKMFEALVKANKEVFITEAASVRNAINHFIRQTLKNHPELA